MVELHWWKHVETMYLKNSKNAKIQQISLRGEMAEIKIFFKNSLKDAIKKLCSKFGWPAMIGSLWNCVPSLGTWSLDVDAAAEETIYGSTSQISQVHNFGTNENFTMR